MINFTVTQWFGKLLLTPPTTHYDWERIGSSEYQRPEIYWVRCRVAGSKTEVYLQPLIPDKYMCGLVQSSKELNNACNNAGWKIIEEKDLSLYELKYKISKNWKGADHPTNENTI